MYMIYMTKHELYMKLSQEQVHYSHSHSGVLGCYTNTYVNLIVTTFLDNNRLFHMYHINMYIHFTRCHLHLQLLTTSLKESLVPFPRSANGNSLSTEKECIILEKNTFGALISTWLPKHCTVSRSSWLVWVIILKAMSGNMYNLRYCVHTWTGWCLCIYCFYNPGVQCQPRWLKWISIKFSLITSLAAKN